MPRRARGADISRASRSTRNMQRHRQRQALTASKKPVQEVCDYLISAMSAEDNEKLTAAKVKAAKNCSDSVDNDDTPEIKTSKNIAQAEQ